MGVITLVRHGQASFGSADYDRLSGLGQHQSEVLGEHLGAGRRPDLIVVGSLLRQRQTMETLVGAAGWGEVPVRVDPAWDEYDHEDLITAAEQAASLETPTAQAAPQASYQSRLETALRWWAQQQPESWRAFRARCESGLASVVAQAGPGRSVLVVSSAGPISWACASTLAQSSSREVDVDQWLPLNRVLVNTSTSRLVVGRSGTTLLTINEHQHLAAADVTNR